MTINNATSVGTTPLHWAAHNGDPDAIRNLLGFLPGDAGSKFKPHVPETSAPEIPEPPATIKAVYSAAAGRDLAAPERASFKKRPRGLGL